VNISMLTRRTRWRIRKLLTYTVASVIAVIFFFPLYYTVINSLRPIVSTPALIVPKGFELVNYYYAVTLIPFFKYVFNTLIILLVGMGTGLVFNFLYGYALARLRAPGKSIVFLIVLSQMMVPFIAIQIPQYILFSNFGLKDSYWIYVINAVAGNSLIVFIYKQYLMGIPRSLEEAAMIDGCSVFSVMWRVILPISKPIIAVVIFKDFLQYWNDYMTPYMYLSADKYPVAMALFGMSYTFPNNPGLKLVPVQSAAAILILIPSTILFFLCQKQLVRGVVSGSIKE